jgi:hypothetical protein
MKRGGRVEHAVDRLSAYILKLFYAVNNTALFLCSGLKQKSRLSAALDFNNLKSSSTFSLSFSLSRPGFLLRLPFSLLTPLNK